MLRAAVPILSLVTVAVLAMMGDAARADPSWPPRLVRIVVPFAPGSTPDLVGRVLADSMQARHPAARFIVENKAGASGNIGTDLVAKATPDGATLGISLGGPLAVNALLFPKLPYDPVTDVTPVSMLTTLPSVLVTPASGGVATVADFLARTRAGSTAFASIGAGSLSHLCMEAIAQRAGTKMVHIPYAGSPAAAMALIRGDVQAACLPAISVAPQAAAGALRILAVATPQRSPFLPDVPTLKESGVDVQSDAWNALIAPRGADAALVALISAEVHKTLAEPEVIERLRAQMIVPAPSSPGQLRDRIADERRLWADVIRAAGIRIE